MMLSALPRAVKAVAAVFVAVMVLHSRGDWEEVASVDSGATGGDIIRKISNPDGTIEYAHIFTNTAAAATFAIPDDNNINLDSFRVLAVGGGGSGGDDCGGGGGGGGVVTNAPAFTAGEYIIRVGRGGAARAHGNIANNTTYNPGKAPAGPGEDGVATAITNVTTGVEMALALGGGGGGNWSTTAGRNGGSGGGSCGSGTAGQALQTAPGLGNNGAVGSSSNIGGGGGGAGGPGVAAPDTNTGGAGGPGFSSDITGEAVTYSMGGGGGGNTGTIAYGGGDSSNTYGDGGTSTKAGQAGQDATGGGGGGGSRNNYRLSGAGGGGIVVIRYAIAFSADGDVGEAENAEGKSETYYKWTKDGHFGFTGAVKARYLVVGGGGSGANPGSSTGSTSSSYGGAGGGGAGGLVEGSFYLPGGVYAIGVGAGGAAQGTNNRAGNDGAPSYIAVYGTSVTNVFAYGGGGGGIANSNGNAPGHAGGSGGGSSWRAAVTNALGVVVGGAASQPSSQWGGLGNPGGDGAEKQGGAGGGGAGGKGGDADTQNVGGVGGVGYESDITGESVWYAAGGGGGSATGTVSSGGSGVGGNGATGSTAATAGRVGTGSGGGGGSNSSSARAGGAGGDGVVIIRIEAIRTTPLVKPGIATNLSANARWLGAFNYTGTEINAYEDFDAIFQDADGVMAATDVTETDGYYTFTLSLKPGLVWSDGTDDSLTCYWRINPTPLEVVSFRMAGWQLGERANLPVLESIPSLVYGEDADYTYQKKAATASESAWQNCTAEELVALPAGDYKVRLAVKASSGYSFPDGWTQIAGGKYTSDEVTASFSVCTVPEDVDFLDCLGYHAVFTVTDSPAKALANFPMLVKIDPVRIPEIYRQAAPDASDIRFTSPYDAAIQYPFEIDTWNPDGESLIWVRMPEYAAGARVVMNWGRIAAEDEEGHVAYDDFGQIIPAELPAVSDESVWSEYAGVWHMADASDSSANNTPGTIGSVASATDGVFGDALGASSQGSPLMTATKNAAIDALTNGAFTVSFWVYYNSVNSHMPYLFSRQTAEGVPGYGARLYSSGSHVAGVNPTDNTTCMAFYVGGAAGNRWTKNDVTGFGVGQWSKVDVIYGGTYIQCWVDGVKRTEVTGISAAYSVKNGDVDLAIGGLVNGTANTLDGAIDEFRMYSGADEAWLKAEYAQAGEVYSTSVIYTTPNKTFINRWLSHGAVSPASIPVGGTIVVTPNEGVYGGVATNWYFRSDADGSKILDQDASKLPAGSYVIVFQIEDGGDGDSGTRKWNGLVEEIALTVVQSLPVYQLGDAAAVTRLGRILLVNDDDNSTQSVRSRQPVEGQSYYLAEDNVEGDNATYWVHEADSSNLGTYSRLYPGARNHLMSKSPVDELCGSSEIWYLDNVRIGNAITYPGGNRLIRGDSCYLPQSATAKAISSATGPEGSLDESAHMVMRNIEDAAIYSPLYRDGIGTIYFDAVNAWTNHYNGAENYKIAVEIATEESCGFSPTDANIYQETEKIDQNTGLPVTSRSVVSVGWQPVKLTALKIEDGTVKSAVQSDGELTLDIEKGGGFNNFYRVIVDKDTLSITNAVRFRIRRTATVPNYEADAGGFILIDNLEVSLPTMRADLKPLGNYDPDKTGSDVTGWSGTCDPAFPSVTSKAIYPRMEGEYYTNSLANVEAAGSNLLVSATLFYRWRYLGYGADPVGGGWRSVRLAREEGGYRTASPIEVPKMVGDVEFWSVLNQAAPYYRYCDYSGLNIGVGGYTEEVTVITNVCQDESVTAKTLGKDWFVRLRDGASTWEKFGVTIVEDDGATTNTLWGTLAGDAIWRCYYKTPTNKVGKTVKFRVEGANRQTNGSRTWEENTVLFAIDKSSTTSKSDDGKFNSSFVAREEFTDDDWQELELDTKTGYLLFQMEEASRAISVVHADYQNFNDWSDAKGDKFVGAFSENEQGPESGTSPEKRTYPEDFSTWNTMLATYSDNPENELWQESFTDQNGLSTQFFTTTNTPNGWTANQGKFVSEKFADTTSGYALQMRGNGFGSIQYVTSGTTQPRGIDTLSFTTRLANSIDSDSISFCNQDGMSVLSNYTYIAGVKAVTSGITSLQGEVTASLVTCYRQWEGFYEFRVVKTGESKSALELWKWAKVKGKINGYRLGRKTLSVDVLANSRMTRTGNEMNNYAIMGVCVTNTASGVGLTGFINANGTYAYGGTDSGTPSVYAVSYTDNGTVGGAALRKGTVGAVSANCPATFYRPRYYLSPISITGGQTAQGDSGSYPGFSSRINNGNTYPALTFPTGTANYVLDKDREILDPTTELPVEHEDWALAPDRMSVTNVVNGAYSYAGLCALAPQQTLGVFLAPGGKTTFSNTPVAKVTVSSFVTNNVSLALRQVDDCALQIRVYEDDNPSEVVIDNIKFTQWRGADWKDLDTSIITQKGGDLTYYAYTNFTFTSCWVTNHTVLMSARRTSPDSVCSIVTPLMDGASYGRGSYVAGTGLGQISFAWHGAQANALIAVQVLTNYPSATQGAIYSHAWEKDGGWETVKEFTYDDLTGGDSTKTKGVCSCYFGYHGIHGLARIVVSPSLVDSVAGSMDPKKFGEIYIDSVEFRDEPEIDYRSWWGWNIRTDGDSVDSAKRMFLSDVGEGSSHGLYLALNDSVTKDVKPSDAATYVRHMPFVQTPTFGESTVGAVYFKARKYAYTAKETADYAELNETPATLSLYGSQMGEENGLWTHICDFTVTTNLYGSFEYALSANAKEKTFKAFRFLVRGVSSVDEDATYDDHAGQGDDDAHPVRIIIDEMAVMEAIAPRVGFRNVGAFRDDMNKLNIVPGVPGEAQQPLCKEGWGVQCEIYKAQLPDKIDLDSVKNPPRVFLHYYEGTNVWGYLNWKDDAKAKTVELERAEMDEDATEPSFVYRSSYLSSKNNVIPMSQESTVVQYSLEVQYNQRNDAGETVTVTDILQPTDWPTPSWYRPIDYNADYGEFSAYNILDYVAPHWAWINEINILGELNGSANSDDNCQFVEVAAPAGADLTGWYLQFVEDKSSGVITNKAAVFGQDGLSGTKDRYVNTEYGMTFRVIASPDSQQSAGRGGKLNYEDGTLDGVWDFTGGTSAYRTGIFSPYYPVAVQLVRPSGILESEIVTVGTNYFRKWPNQSQLWPEETAKTLNERMKGSHFIYIGDDDNVSDGVYVNSLSVITNDGGSSACWEYPEICWTNGVVRTPGRINSGQVIVGKAPNPGGMSRLIFATLEGGRIAQWNADGDADEYGNKWTEDDITLYVQRKVGTNLVYRVPSWHRVQSVKWFETGVSPIVTNTALAYVNGGKSDEYFVNIGTNVDGNITVIATSSPEPRVEALIGDGNRYRDAIIQWLMNRKSLDNEDWDDGDNLYLADFRNLSLNLVTNLTLTQMYWLDIPPTTSNMWLVGGVDSFDFEVPYISPATHDHYTNTLIVAKLYITNANETSIYMHDGKRGWSPYVLRGMDPGRTSLDYVDDQGRWAWTNAMFSVKGKLWSLLSGTSQSRYWVPMRWFVFTRDSFDENHKSTIEILDYRHISSPAYDGWIDWISSEEGKDDHPFYSFSLDDETTVYEQELLQPTNRYESATE